MDFKEYLHGLKISLSSSVFSVRCHSKRRLMIWKIWHLSEFKHPYNKQLSVNELDFVWDCVARSQMPDQPAYQHKLIIMPLMCSAIATSRISYYVYQGIHYNCWCADCRVDIVIFGSLKKIEPSRLVIGLDTLKLCWDGSFCSKTKTNHIVMEMSFVRYLPIIAHCFVIEIQPRGRSGPNHLSACYFGVNISIETNSEDIHGQNVALFGFACWKSLEIQYACASSIKVAIFIPWWIHC